jgi:thiamine biosynthesis lipoprotein
MSKRLFRTLFVGVVVILIGGISVLLTLPSTHVMDGSAFGTYYRIRIIVPRYRGFPQHIQAIQDKAETILHRIDQVMSTYREDSQIAMFNATHSTRPFTIDPWLYHVLDVSLRVSALTHGAFDVTVRPLSLLWGLQGPARHDKPLPHEIRSTLAKVGYRHLELLTGNRIRKTIPDLQIDVSALAEGFAVDQISDLLLDEGISNFVVELGGEIRAHGQPQSNRKWRVGIERPDQQVVAQVVLEDRAIATSGTYQRFLEMEGETYSHILDPRTGYPVQRPLVSVTVLSKSCMWADALATALMVLPIDEGKTIVNQLPDTEAFFLSDTPSKN